MGVVNVTPDSFSDGGLFIRAQDAAAHGERLAHEGADILDIGGESTRPGAEEVSVQQELDRVIPAIEALRRRTPVPISIDTRKAPVMRAAAAAGAALINDVSALTFDAEAAAAAAETGLPVVLMHAQGLPQTMQDDPRYGDVVEEVRAYLAGRMEAAATAGVAREKLIVDPGVGFGKTLAHNLELLANIAAIKALGRPVLVGASRKSFIGKLVPDAAAPDTRLGGSLAAAMAALAGGADIVRVHDVAQTRQAISVHSAISARQPR